MKYIARWALKNMIKKAEKEKENCNNPNGKKVYSFKIHGYYNAIGWLETDKKTIRKYYT